MACEHGMTFSLALIVAVLITILTQVSKDPERFMVRDLVERIELQKIKIKLQRQAQERIEARAARSE